MTTTRTAPKTNRFIHLIRAIPVIAAFSSLLALTAHAQVIDQIEVTPQGAEAEISIRFATTVQYQRHQPATQGNLLQIEFVFTGAADPSRGTLLTETRRAPENAYVPPFEVSYDNRNRFLTIKFSRFTTYAVRQGKDGRSISVFVPLPLAAIPAPPKQAVPPAASAATPAAAALPDIPAPIAASGDVETSAKSMLEQAKLMIAGKSYSAAVDLLNRLLNLPPNKYSEEAQILAGDARAFNGEANKARAEYEFFLKLFPQSLRAAEVTEKLAKLGTVIKTVDGKTVVENKPQWSTYGSVSSYYYRGSTKYDATLAPPVPGLNFDQISLTSTDQSALVTNADLTTRYKTDNTDTKLVLRDTYTANFLDSKRNNNRLNSAYIETLIKDVDLFARVGRQSAPGYGVLGRFDGGWLRYGLGGFGKVSVFAGNPVEFYPSPKKNFYGAGYDFGPLGDHWSGNLFATEQRVDNKIDRRAVGTELRYLDPKKNGFALLDYDTIFKVLNTALVQGNWVLDGGTSFTFLYDRRRSPVLQLTNALNITPFRTVGENIINGTGLAELRAIGKASTPISNLLSVGVTQPISPQWQIGGDFKISDVSGTPTIGIFPAQPGTGNIYVYSGQAIRTGLFTANDIVVLNLSLINGKTYDGQSYQLNHVIIFQEKWRFETALKYYHQKDTFRVELKRFSPTLKLAYRWFDNLSIEAEAGAEYSRSNSPLQSDRTTRDFYTLGIRYDFQ
jgi:TolA-binding protein